IAPFHHLIKRSLADRSSKGPVILGVVKDADPRRASPPDIPLHGDRRRQAREERELENPPERRCFHPTVPALPDPSHSPRNRVKSRFWHGHARPLALGTRTNSNHPGGDRVGHGIVCQSRQTVNHNSRAASDLVILILILIIIEG